MINFINTFLSYVVVMLVIAAVGAVAVTIGLTLRKKKNAKEMQTQNAETAAENK